MGRKIGKGRHKPYKPLSQKRAKQAVAEGNKARKAASPPQQAPQNDAADVDEMVRAMTSEMLEEITDDAIEEELAEGKEELGAFLDELGVAQERDGAHGDHTDPGCAPEVKEFLDSVTEKIAEAIEKSGAGTQKISLPVLQHAMFLTPQFEALKDEMQPVTKIKDFVAFLRSCVVRCDTNADRIRELDNQIQDYLHYIEFSPKQNASNGYRIYKELMEIRRERRLCKNENILLAPIYDFVKSNEETLKQFERLQGACRISKERIKGKSYVIRSNVLDQYVCADGNGIHAGA